MGRRAKYLTYDAVRAADADAGRRYRERQKELSTWYVNVMSSNISVIRASSRQPSAILDLELSGCNIKHHRKTALDLYQGLPPGIPDIIVVYARREFQIASDLQETDDIHSLGLWKQPYQFIPPNIDAVAQNIPEQILLTLATHQFNQLISAASERHEMWMELFREEDDTVEMEMHMRIAAWLRMYDERERGNEGMFREIALEWGARIICTLAEELALSREETYVYYNANRTMNLPWHRLAQIALSL